MSTETDAITTTSCSKRPQQEDGPPNITKNYSRILSATTSKAAESQYPRRNPGPTATRRRRSEPDPSRPETSLCHGPDHHRRLTWKGKVTGYRTPTATRQSRPFKSLRSLARHPNVPCCSSSTVLRVAQARTITAPGSYRSQGMTTLQSTYSEHKLQIF